MGKDKIWSWPAAVGAAHRLGLPSVPPIVANRGRKKGENMYQIAREPAPVTPRYTAGWAKQGIPRLP